MRKLFRSISVQRALVSPFAVRQQIFTQLQLRVVREFGLPDSFSAVLQRAMEGGEAGEEEDWAGAEQPRLAGSLLYTASHPAQPREGGSSQPLSDLMPDIALAGAAMSDLSLSRSAPPPQLPPQLSPDVLDSSVQRWSPRSR